MASNGQTIPKIDARTWTYVRLMAAAVRHAAHSLTCPHGPCARRSRLIHVALRKAALVHQPGHDGDWDAPPWGGVNFRVVVALGENRVKSWKDLPVV